MKKSQITNHKQISKNNEQKTNKKAKNKILNEFGAAAVSRAQRSSLFMF